MCHGHNLSKMPILGMLGGVHHQSFNSQQLFIYLSEGFLLRKGWPYPSYHVLTMVFPDTVVYCTHIVDKTTQLYLGCFNI